jgi:hypothetical protein
MEINNIPTSLYIYKKEIDWSALHLGLNIPILLQSIFYDNINVKLNKGESKNIKFLIDGIEYPAVLTNIAFDRQKYPKHNDLLQIRYTPNSDMAQKLRQVFYCSYNYLRIEKEKLTNKKQQLSVPESIREYMVLYSTSFDDIFSIDCITHDEIIDGKETFKKFDELEIEQIMNAKDNSHLIEKEKTVKIRKLDKTIGDNLKRFYAYKCQICGLFIGELYDATVIHTHHIEYFSVSLNNDADNIMVVCPNHHGIIHAKNPVFDKKGKTFTYPNGLVEGLKLNVHL